ncbi:MAG: UvrD-helicase domain-containing protein [Deltaproteobacteria bacterium]|jgi:DNA helicase-2/ATP-dependent DNA helicase PcrA|nr:UvrD-helicase domain-containing protein [Deltaproteobacteria bacterium]MCL5879694.1 UvrD-helicase domain-containing protein [Deltaproteobacteria bacterium]MDA8304123.1 UvrD-helicase domain-containing protein [Deltaproteobacteria bacterium]
MENKLNKLKISEAQSDEKNQQSPYLNGLNEEQLRAVLHADGPLLILAGAGSGKTRVITLRALHLIKTGMAKPYNILGVTFTNKAAKEMKERIARALGKNSINDLPEFSTFHSFCLKLLRRHADLIGYEKSFIVFDDDDSGKILSKIVKSLNISEKIFTPSKVKYFVERNKNSYVGWEEASLNVKPWEKNYAVIYEAYSKKLKENNAMDFGDLIFNAVKLFEKNPEVLEHYSSVYKYIMVDEFQDTNFIQDKLIKLLAKKHKNICVVGDDDQSIYSFRGANIDNILRFEEAFPNTCVIKLERNYRSTKNILNAASSLVRTNKLRKDKTLKTDKSGGGPITVYRANSDLSEAYFVAREIRRLAREDGYSNKDIAVLYRANSQSRIIEDRLIKESVKYHIYGGLKFYQRKEIKDILSFLRFAVNPKDLVSFGRSVQCVPIGVGEKTVKTMEDIAKKNGMDILTAFKSGLLGEVRGLKNTIAGKSGFDFSGKKDLKNYGNLDLASYFNLILELSYLINSNHSQNKNQKEGENKLEAALNLIYKASGYKSMLRGESKEINDIDQNRIENIEELINASQEFENIMEFLDQSSIDENGGNTEIDADISKVSLMTLHSAKGLEFPVVFLVGLEEQLFPHIRSLGDESSLEEERRLCYVGITRAKEKLYITLSKKRRMAREYKYNLPSRFLKEIPEDLIEEIVDSYEYY